MRTDNSGIPGRLRRSMDAATYATNALSALDEAAFFLSVIEKDYHDLLQNGELEEIISAADAIKSSIHKTNLAANPIYIGFEDAIASYHSKSRYESVLVPKDLIAYENSEKIRIQFPESCKYAGYSTWLSRKFVTDSLAGDMIQVRYYPDWIITLYRYERNQEGRMAPAERREISASEFLRDIHDACTFYMQESQGICMQ